MTHTPTILDIKTDIYRAIYSTYSSQGIEDVNFKVFLKKAIDSIENLNIGDKKKELIDTQIAKSKIIGKSLNRIREDLLLISSLL
jgi:hypothetical protein